MFSRLRGRGLRSRLEQVASGALTDLEIDLAGAPEGADELMAVAGRLTRRSAAVRRLRVAIGPQARGLLLDLLAAEQPATRRRGAQLCGALELEEAVPWLELCLADRDRGVREASARALGRIGGARSAQALLNAFAHDLLPWFRLTVELAKAAPHLYLEQEVARTFWAHERPALIAAMGLRNPAAGGADFLAAVPISGPRDMIAACHVLARAGAWAPGSWVAALRDHSDHRVREAAERALRRIRTAGRAPVYVIGATAQ
ncbi:MAG TPA: HEAT repeat domain-containing protein [Candidatus Dormibacteraeota bacterium]